MFQKLVKFLLSAAALGAAVAAAIYFMKKKSPDDFAEDPVPEEMDSLSLDSDLEPIAKREYVPLNRTSAEE